MMKLPNPSPLMAAKAFMERDHRDQESEAVWALGLFDNLFAGDVLKIENKKFARSLIAELYINPVFARQPSLRDKNLESTLSWLRKTLLPHPRVPGFLKKCLIENFRYNLSCNPAYHSATHKEQLFHMLSLMEDQYREEFEAIPATGIPKIIYEEFFSSPFWSKAIKQSLVYYFETDTKRKEMQSLIESTSHFEEDVLLKHGDYYLIGMYLTLLENQRKNIIPKIAEGRRELPYLHEKTIKIMSDELGRTYSQVEESLRRIFNHNPKR